jgi:hypothetical protein
MNPRLIAEFVFWLTIAAIVFAIYQAAILPGLRLSLRYRVFALRDRLRTLVMNGTVKESDPAFNLLHEQLNFVSCNLFRYDLLRIVRSVNKMTEEQKAYVAARVKIMEGAHEEVRKIYQESIEVVSLSVVINSLFFFVFASICLGVALLCQVGFRHVKEAFKRRIERDTQTALVLPDFAAVAV